MKSRIIKLMSQPESWIPLTNKEQYEFVGYYHDTKGQAFLPFTFEIGGVKFACRRAPCAGVMVTHITYIHLSSLRNYLFIFF